MKMFYLIDEVGEILTKKILTLYYFIHHRKKNKIVNEKEFSCK